MVGKGPHDPNIGYPEHEQHKKASDLSSQVYLTVRFQFLEIFMPHKVSNVPDDHLFYQSISYKLIYDFGKDRYFVL